MFHFPPRRILVPVDLGFQSLRAYNAARLIARRFGARLEVVHCRDPLPAEVAVYAAARDRERQKALSEHLRRRLPDAAAIHVVRGDPARVVLRLAKARRSDLIVMGTHGRSGMSRVLLGSVAESVLHASSVPVLVVRRGFRAPRHVLAPIREDRDAARGLTAAGLVARAFGARLDVMHVVTDPLFGVEPKVLVRSRLSELPVRVQRDVKTTSEIRVGRPVKEILRATHGRDLLVLVERSRSFLEDLFVGTTAERIARRSPIPLLSIPPARRPSAAAR